MKRINKYFQWASGCCAAWTLAALLVGCQDNMTDGASSSVDVASQQEVAFNSIVVGSRQATRADATLINKGETSLLPTSESKRQVGIFGCYTGPYHWLSLNKLKNAESYSDVSTLTEFAWMASEADFAAKQEAVLDSFYTSNVMFNSPADIAEYSNGSNALTYTPQLFWPNQQHYEVVEGSAISSQKHDYMTFFAYYPYNPTSYMGSYGIAITDEQVAKGAGMGKVKFTMHPDASQQNDFLISTPVMDRSRDTNPLIRTDNSPKYAPSPVQFRLYHMLAQVRFYAFINGNDKMVYKEDVATQTDLDAATKKYFRKSDGLTSVVPEGGWLQVGDVVNDVTITAENISTYADEKPAVMNELGSWVELKVGDKIPDESQCVRWVRTNVWNLNHTSRRPDIIYTMEFNNIRTSSTFYPKYNADGSVSIDYDEADVLGSATINHYIMNPYWFTFRDGKRERLNDNYMFGYYEDTPVAKGYNATNATTLKTATDAANMNAYDDYDGWNWTGLTDPLDYQRTESEWEELKVLGNASKHYNYAPGNILLVVPQILRDDDVPHVILTAHGQTTQGGAAAIDNTARVTVNMLKMGISWESGFIYCYAFLDELRPGDDKVRGPESITVLFNTNWYTDQW